MAPRAQPYRVTWPLTPGQVENIDTMFQNLFDDIRNGVLTINVSQVTGVVGVDHGGTGTGTAFTPGSVVFAGTGGVYSQDNANLFWDDTNNRLGVGTASPASPLHVVGNSYFNGHVGILAAPKSGPALYVNNPDSTGIHIKAGSISNTRAMAVFEGSAGVITSVVNAVGALYTKTGIVVSGGFSSTQDANGNLITFVGGESGLSCMIDLVGDTTYGAVSKSSGVTPGANYVGLDSSGNFTFTVNANGQVQWGAGATLASMDVGLSRSAAGTLEINSTAAGVYRDLQLRTLVASTSVSVPAIITASGALTVTPASGSNFNLVLATTGDFVVNTNQLYVDTSAAMVGIGTASPGKTLDVTGEIRSSSTLTVTAGGGNITGTGNSSFTITSSANVNGDNIFKINVPTTTGTVSPILASGSTTTHLSMDVQQNGNGNARFSALVLGTGDPYCQFNINGGQAWSAGLDNSDSDSFKISGASSLGTSDYLTINTSGRVGIGTTGPAGLLDVYDATTGSIYNRTGAAGANWLTSTTSSQIGTYTNHTFFLKSNDATRVTILGAGSVGIAQTSPTAVLHLGAGTATASTAPLKLTSGTSLTTAEAGAIEFTTDDFFATITTGAARKAFILDDGVRLTSGKIPVASTNGRLIDSTVVAANLALLDAANAFSNTGTTSIAGLVDLSGASAGQIKFPATQNSSSNVQTLDDYEEGTWTPVDSSGAGLSFTVHTATYTKIGRMVFFEMYLHYPTTASGANAIIGGLPFTNVRECAVSCSSSSPTPCVVGSLAGASTTIYPLNTAGFTNLTNVQLSTYFIIASGCYEAAT